MLQSCQNKNNNTVSHYFSPLSDLDTTFYNILNCQNIDRKSIDFFITYKNNSIDLHNYEFLIIFHRNIQYKGAYKPIIKTNYYFCNENELSTSSLIEIYAIDEKRKIVYIWCKKQSYCLPNYQKVYIELNSNEDDNYKIKFDNQFFWR